MDYSKAVHKAILFMEDNLTSEISLEDIADKVNLSLYHFHRIFSTVTGISLKEYLRRRRLHRAAREVVFKNETVNVLAKRYRFEATEAFIRAFKKEFKITPGELRKKRCYFPEFHKLDTEGIKIIMKRKEEVIMEAQIISKEAMKVIGIKCTTTVKENTIPQLWQRYNALYERIPNKSSQDVCLGICLDSQIEMEDFAEDTPFDYIAGRLVDSLDNIPEDMVGYEIPAGKYILFTHKGALDTLDKTYCAIFGQGLQEHGVEPDKRDQVEVYDHRFEYGAPTSEMDILIPIK